MIADHAVQDSRQALVPSPTYPHSPPLRAIPEHRVHPVHPAHPARGPRLRNASSQSPARPQPGPPCPAPARAPAGAPRGAAPPPPSRAALGRGPPPRRRPTWRSAALGARTPASTRAPRTPCGRKKTQRRRPPASRTPARLAPALCLPEMAPLGYFLFLYSVKQALGSYPIWW